MKTLKVFTLIAAAALTLSVTSCKKDGSGKSVPDPDGTILVAMRNSVNGNTTVYPSSFKSSFRIQSDDNFGSYYGYMEFVTIGKVNGLGKITSIPQSGWAEHVAVMPGYGYVGREDGGVYVGNYNYVRIYVVDYILAAGTDGIIGADVKYQAPFVP